MKISRPVRLPLLLATTAAILVGCRSFDPAVRSAATVPDGYSRSMAQTVPVPDQWWQAFADQELNGLMQKALAGNLDLAVAWARLRQSRAAAVKAGAGRLPSLDGEASRSSSTVLDAGNTDSTNSFSVGLVLSYEADLWGRVRAGQRSANLKTQASRTDLEATALTLSGRVADIWIQLLAANAEIELVKEQVATNDKRQGVLRGRQRKGASTALAVYQQEQTLAASNALLPPLEQNQELLRDRLALLLGQNPGTIKNNAKALPALPPFPKLGVPADLLARRPDVQSALLALQASDWDVTVAKADRLPSLRLTGSLTAADEHLADVFDDWLSRLAAGIVAPIVDGGRRKAEVERRKAVVQQSLITYRATVLQAMHEVEAAIIVEKQQLELKARTQRQFDLANKTLAEADRRYRNGLIDYITVLASSTSAQRLARDLLRVNRAQLRNRITLYKALGGNWPKALTNPDQPKDKQAENE